MSVIIPYSARVFHQRKFQLMEIVASSGVPGAEVAQYAPPRWVGQWETDYLDDSHDLWEATTWVEAQKGGTGTFWGFDFRRPWGRYYTITVPTDPNDMTRASGAGGGAFDGTALTISSLTTTTIGVTGMPQSYRFKKGDRVGLVQSSKRSLHYIVSDLNCSTGGAGTVTVYPPVSTANFTTSATFNVRIPVCTMRIDPGSVDISDENGLTKVSFSATQVFYA